MPKATPPPPPGALGLQERPRVAHAFSEDILPLADPFLGKRDDLHDICEIVHCSLAPVVLPLGPAPDAAVCAQLMRRVAQRRVRQPGTCLAVRIDYRNARFDGLAGMVHHQANSLLQLFLQRRSARLELRFDGYRLGAGILDQQVDLDALVASYRARRIPVDVAVVPQRMAIHQQVAEISIQYLFSLARHSGMPCAAAADRIPIRSVGQDFPHADKRLVQ